MAGPWKVDAPNHGFMLHDGQRIVGAHTAFYSERLVAGRMERFCDLGTWYVLPEFRSHSIRLIKALLAQDGYHFTALTPGHKVVSIHTQLGFHPLDTSPPSFRTCRGRPRRAERRSALTRMLSRAHSPGQS